MFVDLTLKWEDGMLAFPGYPSFESEHLKDYGADGLVSHEFTATSHTGTHVDAPAHFIEGGATIDELDLRTFIGSARVVDLRAYRGEPISAEILEREAPPIEAGERLILLSGDVDALPRNESFFDEASDLTVDAAEWLVEQKVSLLANDFLTEGLDDPDRPVHNTILGAGIPIVEYLSNVDRLAERKRVSLTSLPLSIGGFEAAPARVVAEW